VFPSFSEQQTFPLQSHLYQLVKMAEYPVQVSNVYYLYWNSMYEDRNIADVYTPVMPVWKTQHRRRNLDISMAIIQPGVTRRKGNLEVYERNMVYQFHPQG
jgi:hypothetical protein